jgi:hypothetical protein
MALNEVDPAADRSVGNGSNKVFTYSFEIAAKADLEVLVDAAVKVLDTDYTVSGVGNSGGGSVTFFTAPASGTTVTRLRKQPAKQLSTYTANEAFPHTRIEDDLDKLWMAIQQVKEQLHRAMLLPKSSALVDQGMDVPTVGSFARGKVGGGIDWATVTSAGSITIPVPINQGGTGSTTASAARTALDVPSNAEAILDTLINAKGDLIVGTGNDTPAILTVGADGSVPTADASNANGIVWVPNQPLSLLQNPAMQVNQRQGSTVADDTYTVDRWYALTQTASISYSQQTLQENGTATNIRLTQTQAAAQRIGLATILEAVDSQPLRGQSLTLRPRVRISNSQPIRMAVLEWTGTADSVTSDVVLDWTSGTYTASNFFLAANLTVTGVSATTPSANTWTDMSPLTVTVGSSCNNLIVFLWTEGTAAQNVTLDIGKVRLVPGGYKGDILIPSFAQVLAVSMRYYQKSFRYTVAPVQNAGVGGGSYMFPATSAGATLNISPTVPLAPPLRLETGATLTLYNPSAANAQVRNVTDSADLSASAADNQNQSGFRITATGTAGTAVGEILSVHWTAEAEL